MFELKPRLPHDDPASHIYEEIPELAHQPPPPLPQSNSAIYLDVVVLDESSNKKIVRFNNSIQQNQQQSQKSETLSSFKCILKKNKSSNLHSPQSNHSMSSSASSTSSSSYYVNSSISSSSSSIHSATFNTLIDTFLNRFQQTSAKKSTGKKQRPQLNDLSGSYFSSMSSLTNQTKNQCCRCGSSSSNASRLTFRVTDLTLEDLKIRQKMIYKNEQRISGSAVHV